MSNSTTVLHRCQKAVWFGAWALLLGHSSQALAQNDAELKRLLADRAVLVSDADLIQPMSFAGFADGSVAMLEFQDHQVVKLAPDGKLKWRYGRSGAGPGEFTNPYRVLVMPDQTVLVFDFGNMRIARLSADGKFVDDRRPDMPVNIFNVVALPSGEIAMTGVTRDPRGASKAIHVFSSELQHIRSFGLLPDGVNPRRIVNGAQAGGLTLGLNGELVHTRTWPYELYRYDVAGRALSRTAIHVQVAPPENLEAVSQSGGRTTMRRNVAAVRAKPIDQLAPDRYLGGRLSSQGNRVDLFDAQGRLVSSMPAPSGWNSLAVFDERRQLLWVYGEPDDVTALVTYKLPVPGSAKPASARNRLRF